MLRINIKLKLYKTYSEILHGFDLDSDCVGWDGVDVWTTERGRYSLFHGYETLDTDSISESYIDKLASRTKFNMDIDTSLAARVVTQQDLSRVNTHLRRLISILTPGMGVYINIDFSLDRVEPYGYALDSIQSQREYDVIQPLVNILRQDEWDDEVEDAFLLYPQGLPRVFNIECYDVSKQIIVISADLDGGKIIDLLTIYSTVYKMM